MFVTTFTCDSDFERLCLGCILTVCVCVFSVYCVDSETSAVRSYGDTWLRWRGQRVEYCRCALRGRERCHIVPVISECDLDVYTHKHVDWLTFLSYFLVSFQAHFFVCNEQNVIFCLSICLPALTDLSFVITSLPSLMCPHPCFFSASR